MPWVALGLSSFAQVTDTPAVSLPKQILGSRVCDWSLLSVTSTKTGERRELFDGPTATLVNFECHATTLNPGETPHVPHRHPDEEMIVVKEGALEITINGKSQTAGPGSVFFLASQDLHGLRNAGSACATYLVFRFITATTPPGTETQE